MYESVCAFLNRHGGTILLGVQDSGEVTPEVTPEVKKMLSIMRRCRISRTVSLKVQMPSVFLGASIG